MPFFRSLNTPQEPEYGSIPCICAAFQTTTPQQAKDHSMILQMTTVQVTEKLQRDCEHSSQAQTLLLVIDALSAWLPTAAAFSMYANLLTTCTCYIMLLLKGKSALPLKAAKSR